MPSLMYFVAFITCTGFVVVVLEAVLAGAGRLPEPSMVGQLPSAEALAKITST